MVSLAFVSLFYCMFFFIILADVVVYQFFVIIIFDLMRLPWDLTRYICRKKSTEIICRMHLMFISVQLNKSIKKTQSPTLHSRFGAILLHSSFWNAIFCSRQKKLIYQKKFLLEAVVFVWIFTRPKWCAEHINCLHAWIDCRCVQK